jgi:6-phosphogluconolactonase
MTAKHLWPIICIFLLTATMLSCGGSSSITTQPPKPDFLYAVTLSAPNPNLGLAAFKVDASTGALSPTTTTTFISPIVPQIAVDPASKFLYVSELNSSASAIDIFSIDPITGVPSPTSAFSVTSICALCPPISGPGVPTLDPKGNFLFYGSSSLGVGVFEGIGALTVDSATGALSGVPGSPFPADQAPFFVRVHPSGQFLYTENIDATGSGGVTLQSLSGFSVDSTGALAPVPGSPFTPPVSSTISGLAIHPSGKFLYAPSGSTQNGIMAWSIDTTTGGLTALAGSPYDAGNLAFGPPAFDPSGKFLYVSAGGRGLFGFSVDATSGVLTPLSRSPFASGSALLTPVIDPGGHFLFASDTKNKAIVAFKLDSATGALTPLGTPTLLTGGALMLTIVQAP